MNSAKKSYGLKPPPTSGAHLEPGPQPGPNPQPNPNPHPDPIQQPAPENPAAHEAEDPTRLPRSIRDLAKWAWTRPTRTINHAVILILISVVLVTLARSSMPQICPSGDSLAPPSRNRVNAWGLRHEKAADMYFDAIRWLGLLQGNPGPNPRETTDLVSKRAAAIAERTRQLYSSTAKLKEKFEASGLDEASGLEYLEARLLRGLCEAHFYQLAASPWLLHLGCMSCGNITRTLPCPDHPAAVAMREIKEVRNVLSNISNAHGDLMSQHRAIQRNELKRAHDDVCVSEQWGTLQARAFGACRLTGRELQRGTEFRDEFASTVGEKLNTALNQVNNIGNTLDGVYPDFSWSPEHVNKSAAALNSLLDVVTAQMGGG